MRNLPKNLIRPALMVVPLAFIVGVLAVSFIFTTSNAVLAQDDECDTLAGQLQRILAGDPCPDEETTPTAAEAIQTALAAANAQATAAAANMTATAEAKCRGDSDFGGIDCDGIR